MIFLSHTHPDKGIVRQIADTLSDKYGKEEIFYDEWSIQPGEDIIQRINEGLGSCKFFFFFVSNNSLESKMVELEWQSALCKKVNRGIKFIPVRIDNCCMPHVLESTLYIDLYSQGLEIAVRQIIDVIEGSNTYREKPQFHNVIGYVKKENKTITLEFRAEYYMEPHSRYLILVDNEEEDLKWRVKNRTAYVTWFHDDVKATNGYVCKGIKISHSEATSPNFPFVVELTQKKEKEIKILELARAIGEETYKPIPMKNL